MIHISNERTNCASDSSICRVIPYVLSVTSFSLYGVCTRGVCCALFNEFVLSQEQTLSFLADVQLFNACGLLTLERLTTLVACCFFTGCYSYQRSIETY